MLLLESQHDTGVRERNALALALQSSGRNCNPAPASVFWKLTFPPVSSYPEECVCRRHRYGYCALRHHLHVLIDILHYLRVSAYAMLYPVMFPSRGLFISQTPVGRSIRPTPSFVLISSGSRSQCGPLLLLLLLLLLATPGPGSNESNESELRSHNWVCHQDVP